VCGLWEGGGAFVGGVGEGVCVCIRMCACARKNLCERAHCVFVFV